ncbi:acyl-CoA N-acyltransferase [Sarocladium strictum]
MSALKPTASRKFLPQEVIISEITADDAKSVAEGYFASFPTAWFDRVEPVELRASHAVRVLRFSELVKAWITEPHTRWTKATLAPWSSEFDSVHPNRVIGHAGWLRPGRTASEILNLWRSDAGEKLKWRERMGWTESYEQEIWSGVDLNEYQTKNLLYWDKVRESYVQGVGHWLLAPLWVVPEHHGRGVASLLLRDGIEMAERETPLPPMYLEAMPEARPIYEHFGFRGVEGPGEGVVMIRNPPPGVKTLIKKAPE